jgi:hypothetical protein
MTQDQDTIVNAALVDTLELDAIDGFSLWGDGLIDPGAAIERCAVVLAALDAACEPIDRCRATMRKLAEALLQASGKNHDFPWYGEFAWQQPARTTTYDRKRTDALMHSLVAAGESEIAASLEACRTESTRAGGLRITRHKQPVATPAATDSAA